MQDENERLKIKNSVLKELDSAKQELVYFYQSQYKSLEEENRRFKEELASLSEREITLRVENQGLKEYTIKSLEDEIQQLKIQVESQEQWYQRRREEDLQLDLERRAEERNSNGELWERMMAKVVLNEMEDRSKKRILVDN